MALGAINFDCYILRNCHQTWNYHFSGLRWCLTKLRICRTFRFYNKIDKISGQKINFLRICLFLNIGIIGLDLSDIKTFSRHPIKYLVFSRLTIHHLSQTMVSKKYFIPRSVNSQKMIFHLPHFVVGSMIEPASLLTIKAADLEMSSSKNYHPT